MSIELANESGTVQIFVVKREIWREREKRCVEVDGGKNGSREIEDAVRLKGEKRVKS